MENERAQAAGGEGIPIPAQEAGVRAEEEGAMIPDAALGAEAGAETVPVPIRAPAPAPPAESPPGPAEPAPAPTAEPGPAPTASASAGAPNDGRSAELEMANAICIEAIIASAEALSTDDAAIQARRQQQTREAQQAATCMICLERVVNATFVHGNTGHTCCCYTCASTLGRRRPTCPICRAPIERVIYNFYS